MMKVAGYCRVSTDKDDQANSFQAQQRFFREYIERHPDWELHDIYADEGITGTSTQRRTQFNRMISDAFSGKFQLILTKEISRFSRNILDTILYTRKLKAAGVGVLFMTENLNSLNPESEMLLSFMGTLAQEESRRTSVRVKWGQTRSMEQGVVFGRSMLGYDVKDGIMQVNPEGAELVRLIFHKYGIEKKGTSVIAREMMEAGYLTYAGNTVWNAGHIIKILKNEKYVGDLIQKKTITPDFLSHARKANQGEEPQVTIWNHHAPIIERQLWDLVQSELKLRCKHSGEGHSNRYLFSGKIRCGECGAVLVGRQKVLSDGTKIRRWACGTAVRRGSGACGVGKLVRNDDAENMLRIALSYLRMDREAVIAQVSRLISEGEPPVPDREKLEKEIRQVEKKKISAMDACFSGIITQESLAQIMSAYDSRLSDLHDRLEEAKQRKISRPSVEQALRGILYGEIRSEAFFGALLDHVTVHRDRHMDLHLKHLPHIFRFDSG